MMNSHGNPLAIPPHLEALLYTPTEAARLIGLHPRRVNRWLKGYGFNYGDERHHMKPVVQNSGPIGFASFLDLIDLLFVKQFLSKRLSLQKVRKAFDESRRILETPHFARQCFFTDGQNIYLKVRDHPDSAILKLLSGRQWAIAPVIEALAHKIEFETESGWAQRYFPLGEKGLVVLDPCISFGRPTILHTGIPTSAIYDLHQAEKDIDPVASWFGLSRQQVQAAVEFEHGGELIAAWKGGE